MRLAGILFNGERRDSAFGKTLSSEELTSLIQKFFSLHRENLCKEFEQIAEVVARTDMMCYSCSVLVCWDQTHFRAKLIDFQHSWVGGSKPDEGVLLGLESVIKMLK